MFTLRRLTFMAVVVATACAGCQRPGQKAYLEVLNDEKRVLEDQLYEMAYQYEILEQKLKAMENGTLEGPIDIEVPHHYDGGVEVLPSSEPNPVPDPDEPTETPPTATPPQIEIPGEAPNLPGSLDTPDLTPDAPDTLPPPSIPDLSPPGGGGPTSTGVGHVHEIRLNPVRTGGENFDGVPGDDGVTVLIEPRGPAGEILPQPGGVSVVVVDPAAPDDQARVARWDLTSQEVSERVHREGANRGIYLKLPWTQNRPESSKLHLFVRYTTADGRKLETNREFFIAPNGVIANQWTPRTRKRRIARNNQSPVPAPQTEPPREREPVMPPSPPPSASGDGERSTTSMPLRAVTRPQWRPYR